VSGLTTKPDRPCFYLKTTLLRRSRRKREEGGFSSLEGIPRRQVRVGGVDTAAAAVAAAASAASASVTCVARGCRRGG